MSTTTDIDQFFAEGGAPPAERVNGRYKLVGPDGEEHSYQTASNYAFPLVDQYGLNKWRMRKLLTGVAMRPDLLALLSTMDTTDPDRGKLDEVIETALQVAGTTVDANLGTAVHSALQAADEGKPYPPEYAPFVDYYREALARHGLRVVLTERLVVSPELGAAGRTDRIYEEADGSLVVGDVKTSGRLDLGAHEIAVQFAVYQGASHVRSEDGKGWISLRDGRRIRADYGIVVHVDRETGAVSLYRVDLLIGRHGANLAEQIRGWRKSGPVLLPYVPPVYTAPSTDPGIPQTAPAAEWVGPGNLVRGADGVTTEPADGTRRVFEGREQVFQLGEWMDLPPAAPSPFDGPTMTGPPPGHPEISGAGVPFDGPALNPFGSNQTSPSTTADPGTTGTSETPATPAPGPAESTFQQQVDAHFAYHREHGQDLAPGAPGYLAAHATKIEHPADDQDTKGYKTAAELMKPGTTKAQVQQYCREHGITDLAHTKKVLVEMLSKAGKLAPPGTQSAPAAQPSAAPAVPPSENPHSDIFRQLQLGRIKAAATVGDLEIIRKNVVRAGGDAAWTAEMTEAARARVTELDAATASSDLLGRIAAAQVPEDLARLWEEVTIGNSAPGNWTAELHQAASARLTEINNARPPAPANPFVGG